jgi:hypothetical protein
MSDVKTRGNVIVNKIEIGDVLYEYALGSEIKSEVITKPQRDTDGYWTWKSKIISNGDIIDYGVHERYAHYGPKLYDHQAYIGLRKV